MIKFITAISISFITAVSCLAAGSIEAEFEVKNLEKTEPPLLQKFYVAGEKVAMQTRLGENTGAFIFRGDKSLVWIVDNQNKQYTELTKEGMEQMAQTMNSAMSMMKAQMANMTPEQRAMMEKMMGSQMGQAQGPSAPTPPLTFKKTGTKKTINGYPCEKYDVFRGPEKLREMWVTEWKNMKDFTEAMTAFNAMGAFFSSLTESLKDNPLVKTMDIPYSHTTELNGFPVMTTEVKNGVPVMEMTLKGVTKKTLPESYFVPPSGFKANTTMFKPPTTK